jgi:hypothetical protein
MMEFFNWLQDSSVPTWLREADKLYAYDMYLVSHAIGMAGVVGLSSMIALRILGFAQTMPLKPMEKYFPFIYGGFWLNFCSGVVLFISYPVRAVTNPGFYIKMTGVLLAVLTIRRIRTQVFGNPAYLGTAPLPAASKRLAFRLFFIWWFTILAGRLMAYHEIANVEFETTIAVSTLTLALLALGFVGVRLWSATIAPHTPTSAAELKGR